MNTSSTVSEGFAKVPMKLLMPRFVDSSLAVVIAVTVDSDSSLAASQPLCNEHIFPNEIGSVM